MRWFFLFLCAYPLFSLESIQGFWKALREDSEEGCVIAVYEHEGLHYGKIIATFGEDGKIEDSIYKPIKRAPGVEGHPYFSGLDIIWDLEPSGSKYKGKILDPEKGDVYRSELWMDGDNLVVRGKYLVFWRNTIWAPVHTEHFPTGFKIPKLKELKPAVPDGY